MKITIAFLSVFILTGILSAQVTLNQGCNPSAGDIVYRFSADTNGITEGGSGANQTWSYLNLVRIDSAGDIWLLTSSTPYGSQFPASNLSLHDTCYDYFYVDSSAMKYVGYYSNGTVIHYSNFENVMQYPFTYNSTYSTQFSAVIALNGDVIIRNGHAVVTGDAWGTIMLPFGTFNNALRVKQVITINDSSTVNHVAVITTYTVYGWFVPGKKFAVFQVQYTNIDVGGMFNFSYKNVFYNPSSTLIGISQISTQVPSGFGLSQNYPNPFNPSTKINFTVPKSAHVNIIVFDMLGKEVLRPVDGKLEPGTYSVDVNASSISSGVYFYRMTSGDFEETKRMVLLK